MPPMRPCAGSPAEADADTMNFAGQQKQVETAEALAPEAAPIDATETEAAPVKSGMRGRYAWLGTIASLAILAGSLFVLWKLVESCPNMMVERIDENPIPWTDGQTA